MLVVGGVVAFQVQYTFAYNHSAKITGDLHTRSLLGVYDECAAARYQNEKVLDGAFAFNLGLVYNALV